jgi:hypothetical protein
LKGWRKEKLPLSCLQKFAYSTVVIKDSKIDQVTSFFDAMVLPAIELPAYLKGGSFFVRKWR